MNFKSDGTHNFECDECGEIYESYDEDFMEAWRQAKEDGWICFKNDVGDWEHRCENCR